MNKRAIFFLAVLALIGGSLGAYWHFRTDPQLAKVLEMRELMRPEVVREMPREERRQRFADFRAEVEKLTPEQRRKLFEGRPNRFQERIERFQKASRQEQLAILDNIIKQQESFRASQANQNWGPGGPGNRGSLSPEDREKRRREMLDLTTPQQRAQMADFRQQLQQRRQQLGLGPSPWGSRG